MGDNGLLVGCYLCIGRVLVKYKWVWMGIIGEYFGVRGCLLFVLFLWEFRGVLAVGCYEGAIWLLVDWGDRRAAFGFQWILSIVSVWCQ